LFAVSKNAPFKGRFFVLWLILDWRKRKISGNTMMIKPLLILLPLFCLCIPAYAEIYRWTDESGNVVYSDQPRQGAEAVKLPGITSYRGPAVPTSTRQGDNTQQEQQEFTKYSSFAISSPANDATIRENSGRLDVILSLTPDLEEGDSVVYELGGNQFKVKGTSHTFTNVDRGTHTLKASIVDAQGKAVTPVVSTTFHMKRISTLTKPKAQ
jgi:hypothetical protein